jgi:hypothetical protein
VAYTLYSLFVYKNKNFYRNLTYLPYDDDNDAKNHLYTHTQMTPIVCSLVIRVFAYPRLYFIIRSINIPSAAMIEALAHAQ